MRNLILLCTGTLLLASAATACLNDRDTLAREVQAKPDVVRAVTGRFPREPRLYYTMRIEREKKELAANPRLVGYHDDIAVAYDRIGNDDEAIRWIERKRLELPAYDERNETVKENWYRYYANVGTFWIHRWVRNGADKSNLADVRRARDYISKAIAIKPDAHFGREKYQLATMNWILNPDGKSLATALASHGDPDLITGLCGLIELGNAWESVDIFETLAAELLHADTGETHALGTLAALRVQEIEGHGGKSLYPDIERDSANAIAMSVYYGDGRFVEENYKRLRQEADQWQKQRTEYMMARLNQGRHPDTDPTFWSGFKDAGPPHVESENERRQQQARRQAVVIFGGLALILAAALGTLRFLGIRRSRPA